VLNLRFFFFLKLFIIIMSNSLQAQSVSGSSGWQTQLVQDLFDDLIAPAVSLKPTAERERLQDTEFRVVEEGPYPGPRAGLQLGQRQVIMPQGYLWLLMGFVEAEVYGEVSDQPHFSEWWMEYALWRSPLFPATSLGPFYQGPAPRLPLEFAGLTDAQAAQFRTDFQVQLSGGLTSAVLDIMLHELGHHALNRWYIPGETPAAQSRTIEAAADDWATATFESLTTNYPNARITDTRNAIGRMYSVGFVFALNRWRSTAQVEPGETHPLHAERIASVLDEDFCEEIETSVESFCVGMLEMIAQIQGGADLEDSFQERATSGEAFAHYGLGKIYFSRGDFRVGCNHMLEASFRTDRRANQYAGWCIEAGYSFKTMRPENSRNFATRLYRSAYEAGWVDAKAGLLRLGGVP
jgi:hypothetical protein